MDFLSAYHEFSWKFASECLKSEKKNACISPNGVYVLLSAIAQGAVGKTRQEFDTLLSEVSLQTAGNLCRHMEACSVITESSEIFLPSHIQLNPAYEKVVLSEFGETIEKRGALDGFVTLKNKIDFKSSWKEEFKETEGTFYKKPYKERRSPFAHKGFWMFFQREKVYNAIKIPVIYRENANLNYKETESFVSVAIPFNTNCHMVFTMPKNRKLSVCLRDPSFMKDALTLQPTQQSFPTMGIHVMIPAFQVQSDFLNLKDVLKIMGLKRAFEESMAEITQMANEALYIDSVEQESEIEVTSKGAAAYATTTIRMMPLVVGPHRPMTKCIRFDHPFLFAIWMSDLTPVPIFIGTFQGP